MRFDLSDAEWRIIALLLLAQGAGKRRVDDRRVLDAIFSILRTGAPWRALPGCYGPSTTAYNRFNRWAARGIWGQVFEALAGEMPDSLHAIDSTIIKAHRAASGAKGGEQRQAIGRSRGGRSTKVHALVDSADRVRRVLITAGQLHDGRNAHPLIADLPPGSVLPADKSGVQ